VLTRVSASHIRVGTFVFAARSPEELRALADYTMKRHYPRVASYEEFLREVIDAQASLIARWMLVGFIHGVMNTDNMAISGETIDYGPCAFLDAYSPAPVFSSIDRNGRYAFGNQPRIGAWNLARVAEPLRPLLDADNEKAHAIASAALGTFAPAYEKYWLSGIAAKLGLAAIERETAEELLGWMEKNEADYTNTFRALTEGGEIQGLEDWRRRWELRLPSRDLMARHNPALIPRNHKVEEALTAAVEREDMAPFQRLLDLLKRPFEAPPQEFRSPGTPLGYQTFCGT